MAQTKKGKTPRTRRSYSEEFKQEAGTGTDSLATASVGNSADSFDADAAERGAALLSVSFAAVALARVSPVVLGDELLVRARDERRRGARQGEPGGGERLGSSDDVRFEVSRLL